MFESAEDSGHDLWLLRAGWLELFLDPMTKRISHDTSLIKGSHGVFDSENTDTLPILGMSIKPKKETNIMDVTQIAPTILKFFNCSYDLPNDSIL